MKKICLLLAILMLFAVGTSFAAVLAVADNPTSGGGQLKGATATGATSQDIARMSTKVIIVGQYNSEGYIVATYHLSGNKEYASGYDSTAIFWKTVGDNATIVPPTTSVSDDYLNTTNGWNKM